METMNIQHSTPHQRGIIALVLLQRYPSRPSVALWFVPKRTKLVSSSLSKSPNVLVLGIIRVLPKFEMGHPERGRFMRLGWVRIVNFVDFSTYKPPYLQNGAR